MFASLRKAQPVPAELRRNFVHLYFDIAWYGVLSGSAMAFLAVYAARLGASAFLLGLLTAGPAVVNLLFTLPSGRWLETRPIGPAVVWSSVLHRFFYLLFVFLPWLLAPTPQLWAIVLITLVMSIPGTALAVGFNALFADAVPPEWRGHVVGIRSAMLAVAFILTSLLCGYLLDTLPFPASYQVVFAIGFIGAAMSSLHLALIRPTADAARRPRSNAALGDLASPGRLRPAVDAPRLGVGLRWLTRGGGQRLMRLEILRGPFGRVVGVLFAFHVAQFLAIPLFPLVWVNKLHFSDQVIALSQAYFYVAVFFGSLVFARISGRLGNQHTVALGIAFLTMYPVVTSFMWLPWQLMAISLVGGFGWSLVNGAIANYLLERAPADDRPAHLAWYNLALNAGILIGSLGGPVLADAVGLTAALLIAAAARGTSALLVWRLG
ncbi:MAG: MFS transporter [Caldilineales bacterium]|nr:MFS transporter [Caldilineales bacterium]MDW8316874.1 MFS transporter [Anaerolineae bacterium]